MNSLLPPAADTGKPTGIPETTERHHRMKKLNAEDVQKYKTRLTEAGAQLSHLATVPRNTDGTVNRTKVAVAAGAAVGVLATIAVVAVLLGKRR
jgi:hypothetical protein